MIEVKIDNQNVENALRRLIRRAENPRGALLAIGEGLVKSTKYRFVTSTAPDGSKWKPNSPATLRRKGTGLSPLIRKHILADNIFPDIRGNDLFVGSNLKYAAMQQLGGKKSQFPKLWGDIPARPFLGISHDDEGMIAKTVTEYLAAALR